MKGFVTFRKSCVTLGNEISHYSYITPEDGTLVNLSSEPVIWFKDEKTLFDVMLAMIPHVTSVEYIKDLIKEGFEVVTYENYEKEANNAK